MPSTELRMLGRVASDYMNWMDSFGVLPRWVGAQSLQISEWNLRHRILKNDWLKTKLGQDVLITAVGSYSNAGRKAIKGAAVAAYAKVLEVAERVTEPAGPAAVAQFRSHWNSASAYVGKNVIQEGAEFQRLLKHGRTEEWLLQQKDWASAGPQMMIDASEVVLRMKAELAVKEAQLSEEKAALQLARGQLDMLLKEKKALLLQLEKEKEEGPDSSGGDQQKIKDEKVRVMENQLLKKEDEATNLANVALSKAENLEEVERVQADRCEMLNKVVVELQTTIEQQRNRFEEHLNLKGKEAAALQTELSTANRKMQEGAAALEAFKVQREEALERALEAEKVVASAVAAGGAQQRLVSRLADWSSLWNLASQ